MNKGDTSPSLTEVHFNDTTTPGSAEIKPGRNLVIWQNAVSVVIRNAWLQHLKLRILGTINYSDLRNLRLCIDGVQVGQTVTTLDQKGQVDFDLGSKPAPMASGVRSITVMADIITSNARENFVQQLLRIILNLFRFIFGRNISSSQPTFTVSLANPEDFPLLDDDYIPILPKVGQKEFRARTTGIQIIG